MSLKIFGTLISFMLFISANAIAQGQFASEVDLKAGYCLATVRAGSGAIPTDIQKIDPQIVEFITQMNAKFSSLQRYLMTRSRSMNPSAVRELAAAISAGEDAHKRSNSIIDACFKETESKSGFTLEAAASKMQECRVRKQGETEIRRIENCISLDFLPY